MQTKDAHAKMDYRDKIILDYHFILDLIIDYFMTTSALSLFDLLQHLPNQILASQNLDHGFACKVLASWQENALNGEKGACQNFGNHWNRLHTKFVRPGQILARQIWPHQTNP